MAIAVTVTDTWSDGKRQHVIGTLAFTGNYVAAGEAITWNNTAIKSGTAPKWVTIKGAAAGFRYVYTKATKKVLIYSEDGVSGINAELAAAAYPAEVTADIVDFWAVFDQLR